MGCADEKDTIMQEFVRQMLDSLHYSRNACTYAGFLVYPRDILKKTVLTHLFGYCRFNAAHRIE